MTEPNIQSAPALVVEVLSPGTKTGDFVIKKDLFDRFGVREYWIVDPQEDIVTIYHRSSDGSLGEVHSLPEEANAITTPLLPGFSLALDKLFRP